MNIRLLGLNVIYKSDVNQVILLTCHIRNISTLSCPDLNSVHRRGACALAHGHWKTMTKVAWNDYDVWYRIMWVVQVQFNSILVTNYTRDYLHTSFGSNGRNPVKTKVIFVLKDRSCFVLTALWVWVRIPFSVLIYRVSLKIFRNAHIGRIAVLRTYM